MTTELFQYLFITRQNKWQPTTPPPPPITPTKTTTTTTPPSESEYNKIQSPNDNNNYDNDMNMIDNNINTQKNQEIHNRYQYNSCDDDEKIINECIPTNHDDEPLSNDSCSSLSSDDDVVDPVRYHHTCHHATPINKKRGLDRSRYLVLPPPTYYRRRRRRRHFNDTMTLSSSRPTIITRERGLTNDNRRLRRDNRRLLRENKILSQNHRLDRMTTTTTTAEMSMNEPHDACRRHDHPPDDDEASPSSSSSSSLLSRAEKAEAAMVAKDEMIKRLEMNLERLQVTIDVIAGRLHSLPVMSGGDCGVVGSTAVAVAVDNEETEEEVMEEEMDE